MHDGAVRIVAVSYSAPETAVLISMLRAYGIAASGLSAHAAVDPPMMLALGGNRILVQTHDYDVARALIDDCAPHDSLARPLAERFWVNVALTLLLALCIGFIPPPRPASCSPTDRSAPGTAFRSVAFKLA